MTNQFEEEKTRALAYREKELKRARYRAEQEAAMHGDEAAYLALYEKYAALIPWDGWDNESEVNGDAK